MPHNTSAVFFQAEDGIRDYKVTGVQTCALPICWNEFRRKNGRRSARQRRRRSSAIASEMKSGSAPKWSWLREKPKSWTLHEDQSGMDWKDERTGDPGSDRRVFKTHLALCRDCRHGIEGRSRNSVAGKRRTAKSK